MKKKLLILVVSLLCLVMTGSVILMGMAMANNDANDQKSPELQELEHRAQK